MYTIDDCPHVGCRDCKYYKVNADLKSVESTCKRIDHKRIKFVDRPLCAYDCGAFHTPCNDFIPANPEYADFKEWTNFEDFWPVYVKAWLPYEDVDTQVYFTLNGDDDIRYGVPLLSFVDNTMISDGVLHAIDKAYFRRGYADHGIHLYELVHEPINGVVIDTGECL